MNLHTNKIVFTDTLLIAAGQMNIPIFFVEKDYWITLVFALLLGLSTCLLCPIT